MSSAASRDALMPRGPDRIGPGLLLALLVHVGLVGAIAIGVNWRSRAPEAMSAELWSAVPQAAAPRLSEPEPPPPTPQPKPAPPPPPKPAPQPKVEPPPRPQDTRDADIAIEKAKREKERKQQQEEDARREREEQQRKDQAAAAEKQRQAALEKQRQEQAEKQRQEQLEQERQRAEKEKQQKLAEAKREAERKKAEEERIKLAQAQARTAQERIMGLAGASGDARSTGSAKQSSGPSANYAGRVQAKIRPNITYTEDPAGNPFAEFEVRTSPDGTILGTPRLTKSSGIPSWDDAALRAIIKTEVLPRDVDGRVPSPMTIALRPRN